MTGRLGRWFVAAAWWASAGSVAAQPVPLPVGARPTGAADVVATLRAGRRVRVLAGSVRVRGRVRQVAGDTLVVDVGRDGVARTAVASVDALWVESGRATGRGARVGGFVGAVALGGFGLFLSYALNDADVDRTALLPTALGAAAGGVGGAVVGAGVGSLFRTWRRIFP